MKTHYLPGLLLFLVPFLTHGGEPNKDLDRLQGSWLVEAMIERGVKPPENEIKSLEVTIVTNVLTVKEKGKAIAEFKLRLDPAKKPKALDLIHTGEKDKERTDIAIYDLDGDTLRLCIDEEAKERPKEFASPDKSTFSLIVLNRKK